MTLFLRRNLNNTGYRIAKEQFGRTDCAIAKVGIETPSIIYEIKTTFEPQEILNRLSTYKKIKRDFKKLASRLSHIIWQVVILYCKRREVGTKENNPVDLLPVFDFLVSSLNDQKTWRSFQFRN